MTNGGDQPARSRLYAAIEESLTNGPCLDTIAVWQLFMQASSSTRTLVDFSHMSGSAVDLLGEAGVMAAMQALQEEQVGHPGICKIILPRSLPAGMVPRILEALKRTPHVETVETNSVDEFARAQRDSSFKQMIAFVDADRLAQVPEPRPPSMSPALRHRWTAQNRYVLCMDESDYVIRTMTKVHQIQYRMPNDHVFHWNPRPRGQGNPPGREVFARSLRKIGLADRLDIHSHGNPQDISVGDTFRDPSELATWLHCAGLKAVGVLKFTGCQVGCGDFIERLNAELQQRGIEVGYISAYKGMHMNSHVVVSLMGRRYAVDCLLPFKLPIPLLWGTLTGRNVNLLPTPALQKIIKGAANVSFPGTRYVARNSP